MLTEPMKKNLENQHYKIVGSHSAVKICTWTKNSLLDKGVCYKQKFYGIKSHRCMQMTSCLGCANQCVFCWRDPKTPTILDEWHGDVDEPNEIIEKSIEAQRKLLSGFGGNDKVNKKKLEEAQEPNQVALSVVGESIAYPKITELLKKLHKKGNSTFIVTRGQHPERLKELKKECPTQLYISVDGPTEEIFKKTERPLFKDGWKRLHESLELFKELKSKTRTCMRLTCIKGINMLYPEKYAELIKIAEPHFIEVKAYMWVGYSKENLKKENMPLHSEVREWAEQIAKHSGYNFIDESIPSRVVLLMKKDFKNRVMG